MTRSDQTLELSVSEVDVESFAALFDELGGAGITFTRLRELQRADPDWLFSFTTLDNATRVATGDPRVPRSMDTMRDRLGEFALDADACFVAREGEQWVGYTLLDTAASDGERLHQSWTGVLPSHRRRGIATALKVLTIRFAREHRYRLIITSPRASNVASHAMNRRIGFRPIMMGEGG